MKKIVIFVGLVVCIIIAFGCTYLYKLEAAKEACYATGWEFHSYHVTTGRIYCKAFGGVLPVEELAWNKGRMNAYSKKQERQHGQSFFKKE